MLKHLNPNRMSSSTQKALTFCYSGATISGIFSKLISDSRFNNFNPINLNKAFYFEVQTKLLKSPFVITQNLLTLVYSMAQNLYSIL